MNLIPRIIPGLLLVAVLGAIYAAQTSGLDILGRVSATVSSPEPARGPDLPAPEHSADVVTADALDEVGSRIVRYLGGIVIAASKQASAEHVFATQLYIAGIEQLRRDIDTRMSALERKVGALQGKGKRAAKTRARNTPPKPASEPQAGKSSAPGPWSPIVVWAASARQEARDATLRRRRAG